MRYLAILALVLFSVSGFAQQRLSIGTSPQATLTYRLGVTYAQAIENNSDLAARVQPNSGTGVMVPLVNSGELDLGFVNTLEIDQAYSGTGVFQDRPNSELQMIAVLFPIKVGMFVRADSDIKTLKDIKGKRIPSGYTSQKIIQTLSDGILANAGLTEADMETVLVPNIVRGVDEFIAGNVDVAFFALGQAKVAEADAAVGGIRFLPMVDEPKAEQAMQAIAPKTYIDTVQPAKNIAGVSAPLKTMFYDYVLFANKNLSEENGYLLTKLLVDEKDQLAKGMPLFRQLDPKRMHQEDLGVPYHPGALKYYDEKGL